MRKLAFQWHLRLGKLAGAAIFLWAFSGAAMTLEPMLTRWLDPPFPKLKLAALRREAFRLPPAAVLPEGTVAFALRQLGDRSWYEAALADGTMLGFDAATGRPVEPMVSPEEALRSLHAALASTPWRPEVARLVTKHDDVHRKGRLPVYRVPLSGPGEVVLYVWARDGSVERVTTGWSRLLRWLGLGLHTWNLQYLMKNHDDARSLSLVFLVALPLMILSMLAYFLLYLRKRGLAQAGSAPGRSKRAISAAVALALLLQTPGQAALRSAAEAFHGPAAPTVAAVLPGEELINLSSAQPLSGAPALLPHLAAAGLPQGMPAPAGIIAAAIPGSLAVSAAEPGPLATARPHLTAPATVLEPGQRPQPEVPTAATAEEPAESLPLPSLRPAATYVKEQERQGSSPESALGLAARFFSGAVPRSGSTTEVPIEAAGPRSSDLMRPADGESPSAAEPPAPGQPATTAQGPDRRGVWGVYLTHAFNIATLSLLWRIAWPLFTLDWIGKGGLAMTGSFDAVADLVMGLGAGVLVDRFLPTRSMAAASLLRAALGGVLAFAAMGWAPGLPFFLGMSMVHTFALTTIYIGQASVSPQVVRNDGTALQRMNVVLKLITTTIGIPASLAGGWLIAGMGLPAAFAAYAAANVVLAFLYRWLLPWKTTEPASSAAAPKQEPAKDSLAATAWFLLKDKVILGILAATMTAMILAEPLRNTVLPILAKDLLGGGAALLGYVLAAFYAGQLLGSLALLKWGKRVAAVHWVRMAALGLAAFWLLPLVPTSWPLLYVAVGLMAFFTQPAATVLKTLFQQEVAARRPKAVGRAMGVHLVLYSLAVIAETALVGWIFVGMAPSYLATVIALAVAYAVLAVALLGATLLLHRPAAEEPRSHGPKGSGGSSLGALAVLPLFAMGPAQTHAFLGVVFGAVVLWYALSGTVSLLRPALLKRLDPELPPRPTGADPAAFTLAPAQALAMLPPDLAGRARGLIARSVPGFGRKAWYEIQLDDGGIVNLHARTGKRLKSLRSPVFVQAYVERWLAGTPWTMDGKPEFLTEDGDYYRKGELPHYRVRLRGPGSPEIYLSAYDGRVLAIHSKASRTLRWLGMGLHAWGIKALRRIDTLKRLFAPVVLGLPLAALALTALWLRIKSGFSLELPSLSSGPREWHRFLGTFTLFTLLLMAITGPLTLLIPAVTKHLSPQLPPRRTLGPEAFVLSPAQAAEAVLPPEDRAEVKIVSSRATGFRAWYEFELRDGRVMAASAQEAGALPALLDSASVRQDVEAWFAGSRWRVKGEPVLQQEHDDYYKQPELPVYRVDLEGPWGLRLHLSARDGRIVHPLVERTRLERFMLRYIMGVHTLESTPLGSREWLRRGVLIGFITIPIALTVLTAFLSRLL